MKPTENLERGCARSHPHEDMDIVCELRAEVARVRSAAARGETAIPDVNLDIVLKAASVIVFWRDQKFRHQSARQTEFERAEKLSAAAPVAHPPTAAGGVVERLLDALKDLAEGIDVPERNCSCHIAPPCSDCVDFSHLRELLNNAHHTIAEVEALSPPPQHKHRMG